MTPATRPPRTPRILAARVDVDVTGLRWLGGAMLGLGVVLPHLPGHPGLPCPLRTSTGVPCPLCGMTTSVKALMGGHWAAAVAANPFGYLVVAVAALLVLRPRLRRLPVPLSLFATVAAGSWAWELHRFKFF